MSIRSAAAAIFLTATICDIKLSAADAPESAAVREPRCIAGNPFGGKTCLESNGYTLDVANADGKIVWRGNPLPGPYFGPQCVIDVQSAIKVCVEPDGHHLSATAGSGKRLWYRTPFVDAKLSLYRAPKAPTINTIRAGNFEIRPRGIPGRTVWIMFASSQFGEVALKTGDFTFEGQN